MSTHAENTGWDLEADVVVLGSGGAALTAAVAASEFGARDVILLEKSNMVGGTTAMSGGVLWVPNNPHQQAAGLPDTWDDAVTYLDSLAPGLLDPETLEAFLTEGPEMLRFLSESTPVRLRVFTGFPDYSPDTPGAVIEGGRSLDNDVFPFAELGNWATRVVPPKSGTPLRMSMVEARYSAPTPEVLAARQRSDSRGQGQALVGGLLKAVLDRDIGIHFEHRARDLITQNARVVGVIAQTPTGDRRVRARKGVVLATGGFEWNPELVKTFLRGPMTAPMSVPENEGDGLIMAMKVGAKLGNMANAWWMPSTLESEVQHRDAKPNFLLCLSERTLPGSILVNRAGRRFANESASYNALGMALHAFDAASHSYPNLPYFLIFDQRYRDHYAPFGFPAERPLSPIFKTAQDLPALAGLIGVDPSTLVQTVAQFNAGALAGRDDEFHRGNNGYDNFWGDQSFDPPFCTLGVLDQPPYYAVAMEAGTLGTNGGPKTNGQAQVLDWNDQPIAGLYAAGNAMAAPTTMVYGGAGGTLGPGLTFGYIAGRHAASRTSD